MRRKWMLGTLLSTFLMTISLGAFVACGESGAQQGQ